MIASGVRVGKGDARAAGAEVAQHDDAVRRQSRRRAQARQRRRRVGDEGGRNAAGRKGGLGPQRAAQRADHTGSPMRGDGDRDGRAAACRAADGVECLDEDDFAAVRRAVRCDEWHGVTDTVDEPGQHQTRLVGARTRRPPEHGR
jgi:hypothetical protein